MSRGLPRRRTGTGERSERKALLAQLSDVEAAWSARLDHVEAAKRPSPAALRQCAARLSACLVDEASRVHPLVRTHLPIEAGTLDVVRDEHATLRNLVRLLYERLEAFERGDSGADAEVDVVLRDLIEVWRTHVRRFDRVIDPLLQRLEKAR